MTDVCEGESVFSPLKKVPVCVGPFYIGKRIKC